MLEREDSRSLSAAVTRFEVLSLSSLESFTALSEWSDGIDLRRLEPCDRLCVQTQNSTYRIELLDPTSRRVTIRGGVLFNEPTEVFIHGASGGGAMLVMGWIGIGLQLEIICPLTEIHSQNVVTSPVVSLSLERMCGSAKPA